jgi:hypothetical protein
MTYIFITTTSLVAIVLFIFALVPDKKPLPTPSQKEMKTVAHVEPIVLTVSTQGNIGKTNMMVSGFGSQSQPISVGDVGNIKYPNSVKPEEFAGARL